MDYLCLRLVLEKCMLCMEDKMKKLLLLLFLLSSTGLAQIVASVNGTLNPLATGVIASSQVNLLPGSSTNITTTFTILGSPATFSAQLETSTNNGTSYSICGQAITATSGTQTINCAGVFDHAQLNVTILTGGTNPSLVWGIVATAPIGGGLNPCQNSNFTVQSVSIAISSSTTISIIAPITGAKVTVCGFLLVPTGTNPTVQFEYGTGATCGTGTNVLTGAMAPTAGTTLSYGIGGSSLQSTPVSQRVCIVTGGTPNVQGVVTFVQQ